MRRKRHPGLADVRALIVATSEGSAAHRKRRDRIGSFDVTDLTLADLPDREIGLVLHGTNTQKPKRVSRLA